MDARPLIQKWLDTEFPRLSSMNALSIHLDDLYKLNMDKGTMLHAGLEALTVLRGQLQRRQPPLLPVLAFPLLTLSNQLSRRVPADLRSMLDELDSQPPSLYVIYPEIFILSEQWEEYQHPLPFTLPIANPKDYYAYYREFRTVEGIEYDGQYGRDVCIRPRSIQSASSLA